MDLFLNFKNKSYESKFHESIDAYLSKVMKTVFIWLIAIVPFYPYSEYVTIQQSTDRGVDIVNAVIITAFYSLTLLCGLIICTMKPIIRRHQKLTRWTFDIFFSLFGGYFAYLLWVFVISQQDPINIYSLGWLHAFMIVLILNPISRWYLKLAAYLAVILRIGICAIIADNNNLFVILKIIQITIMESLVIYLSERDKRKYFIEKQLLFEETKVYKEIFELASDGVVIYGLKEGLMFDNWSNDEKYRWRNSEQSLQENFEKILIKGYKTIGQLPSNIVLDLDSIVNPSSQANFWVFLNHLTQHLSPYTISAQNPSTFVSQTLSPGNLMLLTGTVDQQSPEHIASSNSYLLEIKIMLTIFREKPSLVFVFSDITERNLVTMLQENNNYKDRLLASVSHELRTPLNASINFTQAAIEHPDLHALSDVRDNYLMPALRSNQVLLHLINDLLDFSQMSANKLRLVYENKDVAETLNDCMNLLKIQTTRKGLKLSLDFVTEDDKSEFCTDHNRLKQIVLNLLSNALKFTLKGEIKVSARISFRQEFNIGGRTSGIAGAGQRSLSVTVTDTGIGISEENKKKLFRAFEKIQLGDRMPINSNGVGLGLVISNNLVLMLGPPEQNNRMKVESEEMKGSTFSFWIVEKFEEEHRINISRSPSGINPIKIDEHESEYQENRIETITGALPKKTMDLLNSERRDNILSTEPSPPNQNLLAVETVKYPRILIVDDDIFNISALQMIISKLGYSCDSAYNGEQAIQKVLERNQEIRRAGFSKSVQYKLIFMDWSMPIMNGSEATINLKNKMKNKEIEEIAIVACTAFWSEKEKARALEFGIDGFCFKPLNKEKVSVLVKKFVPVKI